MVNLDDSYNNVLEVLENTDASVVFYLEDGEHEDGEPDEGELVLEEIDTSIATKDQWISIIEQYNIREKNYRIVFCENSFFKACFLDKK